MAVLKIRDNNGNVTEIPALKGNNGKSPYIKNGTWWTYNDETGQWEDTGVSTSSVVTDSELSNTSANPVQNKVITEKLSVDKNATINSKSLFKNFKTTPENISKLDAPIITFEDSNMCKINGITYTALRGIPPEFYNLNLEEATVEDFNKLLNSLQPNIYYWDFLNNSEDDVDLPQNLNTTLVYRYNNEIFTSSIFSVAYYTDRLYIENQKVKSKTFYRVRETCETENGIGFEYGYGPLGDNGVHNSTILELITKGTGDKFLANDGTYKQATDTSVGDLIIDLFSSSPGDNTITQEQYNIIKTYIEKNPSKIIPFSNGDYRVVFIGGNIDTETNEIYLNTIQLLDGSYYEYVYIISPDLSITFHGLNSVINLTDDNNLTIHAGFDDRRADVTLSLNGTGSKFLSDNGEYKEISTITTDSSLSATSTNPIQNKAVTTALDGKVDKVTGKVLSSNDYTTEEKTKLSGIATGAQKNVQADWNATNGDAFIKNKPTIPSVDATLSATSVNPVQNKVITNALDSKVDAVAGKGLSTMDYDTTVGDLIISILFSDTKSITQEQYNTIYNYLFSDNYKYIPFSINEASIASISGKASTDGISIMMVTTEVPVTLNVSGFMITPDLKIEYTAYSSQIGGGGGELTLTTVAFENEKQIIDETITLQTKGTGNKYLADDGTYKSAVIDTTVGDLIISIFQDAGTTVTKEQYDTIKNYIANEQNKIIPFNNSTAKVTTILGSGYESNVQIFLFTQDRWNKTTTTLSIASNLNKIIKTYTTRVMPTSDGNISVLVDNKNDGNPNEITFVKTGNGTLFLSDDGTYKETVTKTSQLTNDSNYVTDTTVDSKISTALTPYSTTEVNDSKYIDKTNGIEMLPKELDPLLVWLVLDQIPEVIANKILNYVSEGTKKIYIPAIDTSSIIRIEVTTTTIVVSELSPNNSKAITYTYNRETKKTTKDDTNNIKFETSNNGSKFLADNGKYVIPNDNGTNKALADSLQTILGTFSNSTDFSNADATTFISELKNVITIDDTVKSCYCHNDLLDLKLSVNSPDNNILVNGVGTYSFGGYILINITFHMTIDSTTKKVSDGSYMHIYHEPSNSNATISVASNGTQNDITFITNGKGTKVLTDGGEYSSLPDLFKYLRKQITTAEDLAQLSIEYLMYDVVLTSNARLGYANSLPIIGTETRVIITNAGASNITITVPSEWKASTHSITISANDTKLIRLNNSMSGLLVTVD